mgnify:CR=1 FL=1
MRIDVEANILGLTFGRLVVVSKHEKSRFLCRCVCGNEKIVFKHNLVAGRTRSCGCLNRENLDSSGTHRKTKTTIYKTWSAMKARCNRVISNDYANYGGRGISVCDRWNSFENFFLDMGDRPDGTSIERIDNNGNYEPGNCRWATFGEQSRNKSSNRVIAFNGESACVAEWAETTGIPSNVITRRLNTGWPIKDALTLPVTGSHVGKLIEFNGVRMGLAEWAKKLGISQTGLHSRLTRGWSIERALTT